MPAAWEIRGLFGNEYAMEEAVEELKKHKGVTWESLDRRNLSVKLPRRDESTEGIVRRTIEIYHGYVEYEGPVGEYDKIRAKEREKKLKREEEKKKRK